MRQAPLSSVRHVSIIASVAKCKPLPPTAAIDTVRSFSAFVVFSSEKASPESHRYLVLRPRHGHAPRRAEESSGTIG